MFFWCQREGKGERGQWFVFQLKGVRIVSQP